MNKRKLLWYGFILIWIIESIIFYPKDLMLKTQLKSSFGLIVSISLCSMIWCYITEKATSPNFRLKKVKALL